VRLTLAHGLPLRIGDRALVRDPDAAAERAAQLAAVVAAQAAANPLEPGMPLETARQVVGLPDAGRLTELGLGVKQLAAAARAGQLLTVSDGIYLLPGADVAAAELLAELPTPFTLSEARQALDTTRRVAAVHYRLAPEHPFPAALEDALAAVAWVAEHATEIGADAERLAVGGDSSGASVTTAARRRRDLRLQVLVYPATDAAMDTPSHERYATGYYLERDEMRSSWDTYLGGADPTDPDASPLRADDLAGVAPALVLVAGFDPLHDEGVAYAERLQAAGVPVELVEFEGQIHGFLRWLAVPLGAGRLDHHPEGELEV
jgi:dienelactone hydrolase